MCRLLTVLALVCAAVPAAAQVQYRPTDPPIVTADNESWYRAGEPLQFAGDLFYPAGARVFFDGNTMVRTGHYNGVPLYADTTLEPHSILFVPLGRGLMQPYERPRRGDLAGTTGSRAPAFPVSNVYEGRGIVQAAVSPTNLPLSPGAISSYTPDASPQVPDGGASVDAQPIATLLRPENNDGVWVRFAGFKWISAGMAVPFRAVEFELIGDYEGFPVFARQRVKDDIIYIPSRAGLVAPYRRKL